MNTSDVISAILGIIAMIGIFIYGFFAVFRTRQLIDFYIKSNRGKYSLSSRWNIFKKLAERQEKMYKSD